MSASEEAQNESLDRALGILREILIHAQPYAGILVTAAASQVARQSLSEIGITLDDRSPEDE